MMGFTRSHVQKLIQDGIMKSIKIHEQRYVTLKEYVLDYMVSNHYRGTGDPVIQIQGNLEEFF
jgi:hypothetical protein